MPATRIDLGKFFGISSRSGWFLWSSGAAVLAANWLGIVIFLVSRSVNSGFLRLHYTAALGVDWVDVWWKIFIFPGFGLAVFFINGFFSGILTKKHRMLGLLMLGATDAVEIMLAIGAGLAIMLNI